MALTYLKFYENEYRTAELIIRDTEENDFEPDNGTAHIENEEYETITSETSIEVIGNRVRLNVPTTVTETKGIYYILWTVWKDGRSYKHKTILNVEELS